MKAVTVQSFDAGVSQGFRAELYPGLGLFFNSRERQHYLIYTLNGARCSMSLPPGAELGLEDIQQFEPSSVNAPRVVSEDVFLRALAISQKPEMAAQFFGSKA